MKQKTNTVLLININIIIAYFRKMYLKLEFYEKINHTINNAVHRPRFAMVCL